MKFLDMLRKLGVFRSGSVKGTYRNAVERPTELMMDDVFNAKKDLVTREDFKKATGRNESAGGAVRFCSQCGKPLEPGSNFCGECGTVAK